MAIINLFLRGLGQACIRSNTARSSGLYRRMGLRTVNTSTAIAAINMINETMMCIVNNNIRRPDEISGNIESEAKNLCHRLLLLIKQPRPYPLHLGSNLTRI